jgi:hypothetical protein
MTTQLHPINEVPEGPFKAAMVAFKDAATGDAGTDKLMVEAAISIMLSTGLALHLRHPHIPLDAHLLGLATLLLEAGKEASEKVAEFVGKGATKQ